MDDRLCARYHQRERLHRKGLTQKAQEVSMDPKSTPRRTANLRTGGTLMRCQTYLAMNQPWRSSFTTPVSSQRPNHLLCRSRAPIPMEQNLTNTSKRKAGRQSVSMKKASEGTGRVRTPASLARLSRSQALLSPFTLTRRKLESTVHLFWNL